MPGAPISEPPCATDALGRRSGLREDFVWIRYILIVTRPASVDRCRPGARTIRFNCGRRRDAVIIVWPELLEARATLARRTADLRPGGARGGRPSRWPVGWTPLPSILTAASRSCSTGRATSPRGPSKGDRRVLEAGVAHIGREVHADPGQLSGQSWRRRRRRRRTMRDCFMLRHSGSLMRPTRRDKCSTEFASSKTQTSSIWLRTGRASVPPPVRATE
jgi:hypothetical protein